MSNGWRETVSDKSSLSDLVEAYLDGRLPADVVETFERALLTDASLRNQLQNLHVLRTAMPRYRHVDAVDLASRGLAAQVSDARTIRTRRTQRLVWSMGVGLATASIVLLQNLPQPSHTISVVTTKPVATTVPNVATVRVPAAAAPSPDGATAPSQPSRRIQERVQERLLTSTDIADVLDEIPLDETVNQLARTADIVTGYWITEADVAMLMEDDNES
jgi:hypothetical protein